jgi:archaetidylinositol phosphate synthase
MMLDEKDIRDEPPIKSWTHLPARWMVRPLVGTRVRPNHLTTLRLLTGLLACAMFALGEFTWSAWAGVIWVFSAFLDRADGELARIGRLSSRGGHLYDFYTDAAINGLFFLAIGIGLRNSWLGEWAIVLGLLGGIGVSGASVLCEVLEHRVADGRKAIEGAGGFDIDDITYAYGPAAWLDWLLPLLLGASIGGPVFAAITLWRIARASQAAVGTKP